MIHSSGPSVNFYTTTGWDRAVEKRADTAWFHQSLQSPSTQFHVVWQGRTLVRQEDHNALLTLNLAAAADLIDLARSVVLLGCDAEVAHIAIDLSPQPEEVPNPCHRGSVRRRAFLFFVFADRREGKIDLGHLEAQVPEIQIRDLNL